MSALSQARPLFTASKLCKSFLSGTSRIQILDELDFSINTGEMIAVVGASGSGKTTLLQILGTLDNPDSGELVFEGDTLTSKNDLELSKFRNKSLGFIFQFHHLLPEFTAIENVMMPGLIAGRTRAVMEPPARTLLEQVGLAQRRDHRVNELSGGEQQRTALARALVMQPALLLADEPTGNLDTQSGNRVFELIKNLCKEMGLATIMVTHNEALAAQMDSVFLLKNAALTNQTTSS